MPIQPPPGTTIIYTPVLSHDAPNGAVGKTIYAANMFVELVGEYNTPTTTTPAVFRLDGGTNKYWFLEYINAEEVIQ